MKEEKAEVKEDIQSDGVSSIASNIEVVSSTSSESEEEFNLETYKVTEPTHNDLMVDCRQITRDRSISEDMTDDHDEIEQLLSELEHRTCVNVRATWAYICSRNGEDNEQFTKLYRPRHIEEQLIDQAKAATNDSISTIVEWFKGWRTFIDNRTNQSDIPSSQDSQGSDSWQGSINDEIETASLFLHGHSGVGKSSLVHACAAMFNFNVIEVHAGQERNGTMIRETLKEATQSERVQKRKQQMSSFFNPKKKTSVGKLEKVETEKNDSLLLFSGVDLLFETKDEGFWGALKKISETTKIPIIFTADTVDANTGMNPANSSARREFDDFDFKEKVFF